MKIYIYTLIFIFGKNQGPDHQLCFFSSFRMLTGGCKGERGGGFYENYVDKKGNQDLCIKKKKVYIYFHMFFKNILVLKNLSA